MRSGYRYANGIGSVQKKVTMQSSLHVRDFLVFFSIFLLKERNEKILSTKKIGTFSEWRTKPTDSNKGEKWTVQRKEKGKGAQSVNGTSMWIIVLQCGSVQIEFTGRRDCRRSCRRHRCRNGRRPQSLATPAHRLDFVLLLARSPAKAASDGQRTVVRSDRRRPASPLVGWSVVALELALFPCASLLMTSPIGHSLVSQWYNTFRDQI